MAIAEEYAAGRQRIVELVAALDDAGAGTTVPTCPRWTVADVVAHLAGVCADVLSGNIGGVGTDPWTDAQVSARRGRPIAELVAEWSEVAPQVEAFSHAFPGRTGAQWVMDLVTHEHDIRTALGRPGARDSKGVGVGVDFVVRSGLDANVSARGLPPITVRAGDRSWTVGTGEPPAGDDAGALDAAAERRSEAALLRPDEDPVERTAPVGTLEAPAFELLRALTGRRSAAQIRALSWSVDPEPYLPAFTFGPFAPTAADVAE